MSHAQTVCQTASESLLSTGCMADWMHTANAFFCLQRQPLHIDLSLRPDLQNRKTADLTAGQYRRRILRIADQAAGIDQMDFFSALFAGDFSKPVCMSEDDDIRVP